MLVTNTITKKILENIVHETFSKFGILSSSSLLDSLKFLGFYYATNAGISINIEDLKTPDVKTKYIETANNEIDFISKQWQQGFVSDTERFQSIIDSWNVATESLKNRIVDYYQNFDPANNLYIMAFSGARGNMSQVRQLVGLRGLMSDQEGKIIDLPIQANFREGLSSIDYIISSYGARKGIVDTALKTADSGYLTRRLIYIGQDLVIRQNDCLTKEGILILVNKNTNIKNLIGRSLIKAYDSKKLKDNIDTLPPFIVEKDIVLNEHWLNEFKQRREPVVLNVRSSLTCKTNGSICQKCYGWDLAHGKIIALGEAVGIIAAQSIGEPGTQLTMRTFHTGGIFTGETLQQIRAPFSGKLIIPKNLKTIISRTNHGTLLLKLQQEAIVHILNWQGIKKEIFFDIGSYLYIGGSSFVKKGQLISEYSTQSIIPGMRRLKPIYTSLSGEIRFENLLIRKMSRNKTETRILKVNQDDGVLWIASGKLFAVPQETEYLFPKKLNKDKPFGRLKIISPHEGWVEFKNNTITIINQKTKITLNLSNLSKTLKNCIVKFKKLIKNYQYVDEHTILGYFEIFPIYEGLIYSIRKKESKYINTLFVIAEDDIWKINSDQVNDFSFFQEKKVVVRSGNTINTNAKFSRSGFFLKKDGFKMIFQNATPIFLSKGTILNHKQGDFVLENKIFATLVNYTQQTEDIVQGLPKIEEIIEARKPKLKCFLAKRPGILLNSSCSANKYKRRINNENIIKCTLNKKIIETEQKQIVENNKKRNNKQIVNFSHSIFLKEKNLIIYNQKIFRKLPIPSIFSESINEPTKISSYELDEYLEDNEKFKENILLTVTKSKKHKIPGDSNSLKFDEWYNINEITKKSNSKRDKSFKLCNYDRSIDNNWNSLKKIDTKYISFNQNSGNYICRTENNNLIFLDYINPVSEYILPESSKIIIEPGMFVDIGEPFTEGIIDVHELLNVFFKYHNVLDGVKNGTIRSLSKFQLLLVNSIQSIYQSQGVNISSKHIEIIVRQMTSKVVVREGGDSPLLAGELIRLSLINEIYDALRNNKPEYKTPKYEPILMSATNSALSKDGFLSAAGFQETKRILAKAAIEGSTDWLRSLKECIIVGRLIPAGSSFLNYKNYLDQIYYFKD